MNIKIKGIEATYSKGTAPHEEDGFIAKPPFLGVIDGLSAPYNLQDPAKLFNGLSGGEMARKIFIKEFHLANSNDPLEEVLLRANAKIRNFQENEGIPLRADELAGLCFTAVKIHKDKLEVIYGGNCFAICEYDVSIYNKNLYVASQKNTHLHENEAKQIIAKLLEKNGNDREQMWIDFLPELKELRSRDINNLKGKYPFALLNGQPEVESCWQREELHIASEKINSIVLLTDGMMPEGFENNVLKGWNEQQAVWNIGKELMAIVEKSGLNGLLAEVRRSEENKARKHTTNCEATAVRVKF